MISPELTALSPLDGRYAAKLTGLRELCSEAGLIRLRVRVEALWLRQLVEQAPWQGERALSAPVAAAVEALSAGIGASEAAEVKAIEAQINHDVKAVEYFIRARLQAAGATAAQLELIHLGCTSEDINNLSYALMLSEARAAHLLPALQRLIDRLRDMAHAYADQPMLARTHGQTASPTTLGKEMANVVARLRRQHAALAEVAILGKFNGAVGNYNAHTAAHSGTDWPAVSRAFVESLGLQWNAYSTQIDPHDWIAEYCDALARINTILIDLSRDFWGYISLGYFRQRTVAKEVGSSTMPHKVNPIDFENAEGNLGIANALLRHFAEKLPISRWQRDLTDSTVLRNMGVGLGHSVLAVLALERGLARLQVDSTRIGADLDEAWEVLGEAVQSALRAAGIPDGYERLKDFTRGRKIDAEAYRSFVATLPLPDIERTRLQALCPRNYTGLAARLAREI